MSNLYQWQENMLEGLPKGQLHIISYGRRTGKSMMAAKYFEQVTFSGSWHDWKEVWIWPWQKQKSSVSGKRIWGNVCRRTSKFVLVRPGEIAGQYATKKEVFVKTLKDNGQGW